MAATTTSKYVVSMGGNGEQCSQNDLRHASSASSKIRQVTPGTKIRQVMDLSSVHNDEGYARIPIAAQVKCPTPHWGSVWNYN